MALDIGWKKLLSDYVPEADIYGGVYLDGDGSMETVDLSGDGIVSEQEAKSFCIANRDGLARFIPFLKVTQGFTADNPMHTLILYEFQTMGYSDFEVETLYKELRGLLEEMRRETEYESDLVQTFPFLGENGELTQFDRMSIVREVMVKSGITFGGAEQTLFTGHFFKRHCNCATGSYSLNFFSHELGQKVDLVELRDHVIARSTEGRVNIDMRYGGALHPDSYYERRYTVSPFSEEIGVYLKSLNERELNSLFLMGLGSALDLIDDRLLDAAEIYAMSISENVFNVTSWSNLGALMLRVGKLDEAIEYSLQAVELDPNFAEACVLISLIYIMKGERQEALEYLEKTLEVDGENAAVRSFYGRLKAVTDEEIENSWIEFVKENVELLHEIEHSYVIRG